MNKYYDFIVIGIYVYFTLIWCTLSVCSIMMKKDILQVTSKRYKLDKLVRNVSTTISAILLLIGLLAYQDKTHHAVYLIYIIVMLISLVLLIIPLPYTFVIVFVTLSRFMKYKSNKYKVIYNSIIASPISILLYGTASGWIGYCAMSPLITYMVNNY